MKLKKNFNWAKSSCTLQTAPPYVGHNSPHLPCFCIAISSAKHSDSQEHRYIGRFAPSPTGPLHQGSLLAALASFLDAKAHGGKWLLRIEDVDQHRTVQGASQTICETLEAHQLFWDETPIIQSDRDVRYIETLQQLAAQEQIFYCNCSRKLLKQHSGPYPGSCRTHKQAHYRPATATEPASHAIRFDVGHKQPIREQFIDRILGQQSFDVEALGDFIIRRRDSLFAYQLAVVVDDADQGVTDIVRGADLLDSTPWQILLQRALGLKSPRYAHLPLLVNSADQSKLSKQTGAPAIDNSHAVGNVLKALEQLGQVLPIVPPSVTRPAPSTISNLKDPQLLRDILAHAITHWDAHKIPVSPQPIGL